MIRDLDDLQERIALEQSYFGQRGWSYEALLYPPVTPATLIHLENQLGVNLPNTYAHFLSISGGLALRLEVPYPDTVPLVDSASLYPVRIVSGATTGVREMLDSCKGGPEASRIINLGADGIVGDYLVLAPDGDDPPVLSCTHDEPAMLFDPRFRIADSFSQFIERLLGASAEGRKHIMFWWPDMFEKDQ